MVAGLYVPGVNGLLPGAGRMFKALCTLCLSILCVFYALYFCVGACGRVGGGLQQMDGMSSVPHEKENGDSEPARTVMVLAATNYP